MARTKRIGVIRARHDGSVPTIADRACIEMFFHNARNTAVFDYWEHVTRGWLDFVGSELMPWVDVTLTVDEALKMRAAQGQKAIDAVKAKVGPLPAGFDGWIVLMHPGTIVVPNPDAATPGQPPTLVVGLDAGSGYSLDGKPACTLPVAGNHTFFCHELGHALGFGHTYGVFNNGIEWDGRPPWDQGQVYGDPYDLMSSASFGTRNMDPTLRQWKGSPIFAGTAPQGWPNAGTTGSMGPAPALAHLHQWDEAMFPAGTVKELPYPLQGQTQRVRLTSAGRNSSGTSLLLLRPNGVDIDAEGRGRVYIEYRGIDGWDRGLHASGTDLARRAVVVHTRTDAPGDGVRTWYRGRVLVPTETDTDVAPAFTPIVVRVVDVDDDAQTVEIEVTSSAPREVEIERIVYTSELAVTNPEIRMSPCGDELTWATRIQQTTTHFKASTRGYGGTGEPGVVSPAITWTVGGVTVPRVAGWGSIEVPTPDGTFTVEYDLTIDPDVLVLVGRGGEPYSTKVRATATEPSGDYGHYADETFDPVGFTQGYDAADRKKLNDCLKSKFDFVHERPLDWLIPEPEDPGWGTLVEMINVGRIQALAAREEQRHPSVAADLRRIAELRVPQLQAR